MGNASLRPTPDVITIDLINPIGKIDLPRPTPAEVEKYSVYDMDKRDERTEEDDKQDMLKLHEDNKYIKVKELTSALVGDDIAERCKNNSEYKEDCSIIRDTMFCMLNGKLFRNDRNLKRSCDTVNWFHGDLYFHLHYSANNLFEDDERHWKVGQELIERFVMLRQVPLHTLARIRGLNVPSFPTPDVTQIVQ